MASWCKEEKKFTNRGNGWYGVTKLIEPYIYWMTLIFRRYGEKDCSNFLEAWMPLVYTITISSTSFNWEEIISKQLSTCAQHDQMTKEGERPTFHMASYLLDVICTRNVFADMNLSWHVAELSVHVYFNVLWENWYKKYYALICDEFIACIHFIIFKKECPRLSASTKKMVAKVGH